MPEIVMKLKIEEIIVAMPSANPAKIEEFFHKCQKSNIPFRVASSIL